MSQLRVAVLASGRGSNLQALLDARKEGRLDVLFAAVLSDKKEAQALERARNNGIPAYWVDPHGFASKERYEEKLLEIIKSHQAGCILLAGYMRVLSPYFINNAGLPILNIHPALLPSFPGLNAQKQALEYGVRYSGCTVHFVDHGVDTGPIILQAVVEVLPEDTEESLSARILQKEHAIYPQAVQLLSEGRIRLEGRRVKILKEGEINE